MTNTDLHQRTLPGLNYVEFYFYCCFDEVFRNWGSWDSELKGTEIQEVLTFLQIRFDQQLVVDIRTDENNHSVEVFHSDPDQRVFAYFDLLKDPTDQNDMFLFGISCTREQEPAIHEKLLKIYRRLKTSSPLSFDMWNGRLYSKVFRSSFYFYKNDQEIYSREMHHHGLSTE